VRPDGKGNGKPATLEDFVARHFPTGGVYTFVGAGGKSSGMRAVARLLARSGLRARITTTTRIGVEEFSAFPVHLVESQADVQRSLHAEQPVQVISAGILGANEKHRGIDPSLIERLTLPSDLVLLVEGDGSRRLPMKAPRPHEPVIPANSAAVFAVMGASAFGERVDSVSCYNPEGLLALLGRPDAVFDVATLLLLAGDPRGCRKGVLPGMAFHLVVNQGDLADRRPFAHGLLEVASASHAFASTLLSWREQRVYETAW
jgi:probable selenium-dependent hydroxylase accessory protein YqeC